MILHYNYNTDNFDHSVLKNNVVSKVKVLLNDSSYIHNKYVIDGKIREFYKQFCNEMKSLADEENVVAVEIYIITSEEYIDEDILTLTLESKKIKLFEFGNSYITNKASSAYDYYPSYQFLRKKNEVEVYDAVKVHQYDWAEDAKNALSEITEGTKTNLIVLDSEFYNNLNPFQLKELNLDSFNNDIVVSYSEYQSLIDTIKDDIELDKPLYDKCIYIGRHATEAFRNSVFLDTLALSNDGIFGGYEVISLDYDILDYAYSSYQWSDRNDEKEMKEYETMLKRLEDCLITKDIHFNIAECFTCCLSRNIEKEFPSIEGLGEFDSERFRTLNIDFYPTNFIFGYVEC